MVRLHKWKVLLVVLLMFQEVQGEFAGYRPSKPGDLEDLEYLISLGLSDRKPRLPIPALQSEISYSLEPERPSSHSSEPFLIVRLKKSKEIRRIPLKARIDLSIEDGVLRFNKDGSLFWVEASLDQNRVENKVFLAGPKGTLIHQEIFFVPVAKNGVLRPDEISLQSSFKDLAEGVWTGEDLIKKDGVERLFLPAQGPLGVVKGAWLKKLDGKWELSELPDPLLPVARLVSSDGKSMVWEGWDDEGYVRFSLPLSKGAFLQKKGSDFFGSVRVRSEKQISCKIEKQCMLLKLSDWVLKEDGRWKVLRKEEDRKAFVDGVKNGELFIFDAISQKGGKKVVQGRLFNEERSQVSNIEVVAQSKKPSLSKRVKGAKR